MGRPFLLVALCLAVALFGVCGTHAHMPGAGHEHEHEHAAGSEHPHAHDGAYTITVLDADHLGDHDDDGDIDIDPVTKAFGKLSLNVFFLAIAVICAVVALLSRSERSVRLPFDPPLRPPKGRRRSYLLPPSQAPPTLLI